MTDNEIIKAFECCASNNCKGCPYDDGTTRCLTLRLPKDALALIKRLQSERDYWRTQYMLKCGDTPASVLVAQAEFEAVRAMHVKALEDRIGRLESELYIARRDCAVAERNHKLAVEEREANAKALIDMTAVHDQSIDNFKAALLKKIFPFNGVDKKQYTINAYAVEKAIEEVAEQMTRG